MAALRRFLYDDSATAAVEYAVMLAMILLAVITAVVAFGSSQNAYWLGINSNLKAHGFGG